MTSHVHAKCAVWRATMGTPLRRLAGLSLLGWLLVGCNTQPPAAPPTESFVQAVDDLQTVRQQIEDAYTSGDGETAHHALHEVSAHLRRVLVRSKTELSEADAADVEAAVEELNQAYVALDAGAHGGEAIAYDTIADKVARNFATLSRLAHGDPADQAGADDNDASPMTEEDGPSLEAASHD